MSAPTQRRKRPAADSEGFGRGGVGMRLVVAAEATLDFGDTPLRHHRTAMGAAGAVVGAVERIEQGLGFARRERIAGADARVAGGAGEKRIASALERLAAAVGGQLLCQIGKE